MGLIMQNTNFINVYGKWIINIIKDILKITIETEEKQK